MLASLYFAAAVRLSLGLFSARGLFGEEVSAAGFGWRRHRRLYGPRLAKAGLISGSIEAAFAWQEK